MAVAFCCLDQKRFQFQATSFVSRVKEILALFKDSLWRLHYTLFSSHQTIVKSYRQALLIIKINVLFLNMRLRLFKTAVVSPEKRWTWLEAFWKKTWPLKCSVGLVQKYLPIAIGRNPFDIPLQPTTFYFWSFWECKWWMVHLLSVKWGIDQKHITFYLYSVKSLTMVTEITKTTKRLHPLACALNIQCILGE